jgi:hypothetical protein
MKKHLFTAFAVMTSLAGYSQNKSISAKPICMANGDTNTVYVGVLNTFMVNGQPKILSVGNSPDLRIENKVDVLEVSAYVEQTKKLIFETDKGLRTVYFHCVKWPLTKSKKGE